jgi:hypothetical protein
MKRKLIRVSCALLVCLVCFASVASNQSFGSDSKKLERILLEIKKLNTRIVEQVIPQIHNTNLSIENVKAEIKQVKGEVNRVKSGNKNVNQQMDILSSVIPAMQGSMERSQAQTMQEIQSLGKRLTQLEGQIKSQREGITQQQQAALDTIKQEVGANLQGMKEGMAKDMERMAQLNQAAFQELINNNEKRLNDQNARVDKSIAVMTEIAKGGSKTNETLASLQAGVVQNSKSLSEQNKKIIDILSKTLKEQETATTKIDTLGGNQSKSDENLKFTRETMVALKAILDKRLVEINKTQQALQVKNDKSQQNADLIKENLLVVDRKMNKLADALKTFQIQGSEVGKAKADLINEKITRLIEILKAIAAEQGKMEKLIASQGGKGSNKQLIDALADLRRKANVNISRSDSILKKLK